MADASREIRDGMRIEWDVHIPVEDGYVVADVIRPENDDQHPVLLAASPYAKGLPFWQGYPDQWTKLVCDRPEVMNGSSGAYQTWEYPDPERWVPLGYACVRVDTRGTGASPGDADFFSPQETRDLYTAVEWAGTQPWSSGKVGMLGISYLAINQWQVAALRPPHLAAICPWEGSSDYYRELTHHGGIVSEFMTCWAPAMVETVQHGRADAPVNPNNGRRVTGPDTIDAAERSKKLITIGDVCDAHLVCDEFYRERSPELADITVPVLSAANWGGMGLHSRGNFEAFNRVSSEQKWLEVHGLEHWTEFYAEYGLDVQRRFFDHFLKGADNGWDRAARVQLNLRTPDGFVRRDENEWPLARTDWTRLYLDLADGDLLPAAPTGVCRASFKARHEVLMFRAQPLPEALEITGPAALKLLRPRLPTTPTSSSPCICSTRTATRSCSPPLASPEPRSPRAGCECRTARSTRTAACRIGPGIRMTASNYLSPARLTRLMSRSGQRRSSRRPDIRWGSRCAGSTMSTRLEASVTLPTAGNCLAAVPIGMSTPATATGRRSTAPRPW